MLTQRQSLVQAWCKWSEKLLRRCWFELLSFLDPWAKCQFRDYYMLCHTQDKENRLSWACQSVGGWTSLGNLSVVQVGHISGTTAVVWSSGQCFSFSGRPCKMLWMLRFRSLTKREDLYISVSARLAENMIIPFLSISSSYHFSPGTEFWFYFLGEFGSLGESRFDKIFLLHTGVCSHWEKITNKWASEKLALTSNCTFLILDSTFVRRSDSMSVSPFYFTWGRWYRMWHQQWDTAMQLEQQKRKDLFVNKLCFRYPLVLAAEQGAPEWDHCGLSLPSSPHLESMHRQIQTKSPFLKHYGEITVDRPLQKIMSNIFFYSIPVNFDPHNWREFSVSNKG